MPSVSRAAGFFISVGGLALLLLLAIFRFYAQASAPARLAPQTRVKGPTASESVLLQVPGKDQALWEPRPSETAAAAPAEDREATNKAAKSDPAVSTAAPVGAADAQPLDAPTRLEVPDLKLDVRIRFVPFQDNTWELSDLGEDVAWLGSSDGRPSDESPVLAGHITLRNGDHGPFRYLGRLKIGALIRLHTERHIYTYRLTEILVVEPEDSRAIASRANSQLTLITCMTWDEATKSYLKRQVVVAQLISPETRKTTISD